MSAALNPREQQRGKGRGRVVDGDGTDVTGFFLRVQHHTITIQRIHCITLASIPASLAFFHSIHFPTFLVQGREFEGKSTRGKKIGKMASSNAPYDAQASTNYKEAFALFDKRGNQRVQTDSLGDLLRACGQNPTLQEIRELEKNVGSDCTSLPSHVNFYQQVSRKEGRRVSREERRRE